MGSESGCVQLGCSALAEKNTKHRMDPALQSHRVELTKLLEAHTWFVKHVQPYRESMRYTARRDEVICMTTARDSKHTARCAVRYWTLARGWVCANGESPVGCR